MRSFHQVPKESDLQSKILTDLRSLGKYCVCFKIIKASDNGVPDIFFSTKLTGPILLEIKKKTGVLRKNQIIMNNKLNLCGIKSLTCYTWNEWVLIKKDIN